MLCYKPGHVKMAPLSLASLSRMGLGAQTAMLVDLNVFRKRAKDCFLPDVSVAKRSGAWRETNPWHVWCGSGVASVAKRRGCVWGETSPWHVWQWYLEYVAVES